MNLGELPVSALVREFAATEIAQFEAELQSDIAQQNKCVRRAMAIADELRSRPGDQRMALATLYDHPNIQVRLMAAKLTLAVAPVAARKVIESIAASKGGPQAMDAGMCLWTLDQGIFKPS